MSILIRHTAVWTGSPGLPGYTQFYQEVTGDTATQAQAGHTAIWSFFNELLILIPEDIDVTVDPVYQLLQSATGEVIGEDPVENASAVINGAFVGNWQRQVGVLVEWVTAQFLNGRKLRGRTYLVPLGNTADDDGTLPTGTLATVTTAAGEIWFPELDFVVWHRPVSGAGGSISTISSAIIRDKAAVLRSRMI